MGEENWGREHKALSCLNNAHPDKTPFHIPARCLKRAVDSLLVFSYFLCRLLGCCKLLKEKLYLRALAVEGFKSISHLTISVNQLL